MNKFGAGSMKLSRYPNNVFSTKHVEGMERAAALLMFPNIADCRYRCYRWAFFGDHWLLELVTGDQVEVYQTAAFIHIPRDGYTFELDGTSRRLMQADTIQ